MCTALVHVIINKKKFHIPANQTGASLKKLVGAHKEDVLFLQRRCEDEVVPDDAEIELEDCSVLHTQPPARYGDVEKQGEVIEQPGGWRFLILRSFAVPEGFSAATADILIKLPPTFPDAAPDMFWVYPPMTLSNGAVPQAATVQQSLLGQNWQRFSWHLEKGAWQPGSSTIRDFVRCVRARLLRGN